MGYFPYLHTLDLTECIQLNDFAVKRITQSCPNLTKLTLDNLNNLTEISLRAISVGCPLLEELYLRNCCCFTDEDIVNLLETMPKLFVTVTRYTSVDLKGVEKEIHSATIEQIFDNYPNTFRVKAFEKTRKRMFGLDS